MDGSTGAYAVPGLDALPAEKRAGFRVVIVGAGMSGLLAGIRLKQAGIPFTIVERASDVGGTWWHNTYPGCRVDSPNHIYSYSFEPADWPQHFSQRQVLQRYFAHCADKYGLRPHIRFDTEVTEAAWDDERSVWRVAVRRLHVAASLGVADRLRDGPRSAGDLAREVGAHPRALYRLLRALAAAGVLREEAGESFALTALGEPLRSDHSASLAAWAVMIGRPYQWQSWGHLLH